MDDPANDPLRLTAPIDPQDPLPEARWFWRRLIVFLSTAATYGLLWVAVLRILPPDMPGVAANLMLLIGVLLVLYLVAPSATQLAELLATLKLRLRGPRRDGAQPPDCEPDTPPHRDRPDQRPPWERGR